MSNSTASNDLQHLRVLVTELQGRYTIGYVPPVNDVIIAMASAPKQVLATLVARDGESLEDLRVRLNVAVGAIMGGAAMINELEDRGIQFSAVRRRMPRRRPPGG